MIRADLSLKHLVRPAADGSQKPPVLIMLHGVGSNEEDLFALAPYLPEQFLVISARGPISMQPGAYAWYHVDFQPDHMEINPDEEAASRKAILAFMDETLKAYGGDPDRVYLMGFSQGSIMSISLLLTHPEKLAGVVAMSGRLLDEVKDEVAPPEALKGKPLMMVHGVADGVIPIRYAREALEFLRKLPIKLFYREYGMAHNVSEESLTDILAWLEDKIGV